ncbi:MAG TPA: DUF1330 domain-containing protein [Rhizomicrobium sp.]|jgi:uncharacterized protein (DUF1330 family)|nr:DUF1330 domain-containing protein [Rhizomicrobium sp.]
MAKGYWIARVDVKNPDAYKMYVEGTVEAFEKYGARFLARGGRSQALEGPARARNVVIEFDSLEQAVACYNSPEYQRAAAHRQGAAEAEILVVEGVA